MNRIKGIMDIIPPVDNQACNLHTRGYCSYADTILALVNKDEHLSSWREELRADVKDIKKTVEGLEVLKIEHGHTRESLTRAFNRIATLEEHKSDMERFIAKVEGMTSLAWVLWTILTSGVGIALFKIL